MTIKRLRHFASSFILLIAFGQSACSSALEVYYCSTDSDCTGAGNGAGRCESTSLCSHADLNCPDGQRYSESAGENRGECVGESSGVDSGADAGVDSGADAGDPRTLCEARFGQASDYQYCSDTPSSCSFSVDLDFDDCGNVCELLGSTCMGAKYNDADSADVCSVIDEEIESADCGSIAFSAICECAI